MGNWLIENFSKPIGFDGICQKLAESALGLVILSDGILHLWIKDSGNGPQPLKCTNHESLVVDFIVCGDHCLLALLEDGNLLQVTLLVVKD